MFAARWLFSSRSGRKGRAEARAIYSFVEQQLELVTRGRMSDMTRAVTDLPDTWHAAFENDVAFLQQIGNLRLALRRARAGSFVPARHESHLCFQVSALMLRDSFDYLVNDPAGHERLHFVTGPITPDGYRVLAHIQKVALSEQSRGFVKADPITSHQYLVQLTEHDGHDLLAAFHSHPLSGAAGTQPSNIDLATQDRFAALGWDAIGGIFSTDGYVRFFGTAKDFEISLYGNGAEIVSTAPRETIVKLELPL